MVGRAVPGEPPSSDTSAHGPSSVAAPIQPLRAHQHGSYLSTRRQDGGVPSQWRRPMGSATRSGRAARWGLHFLASGQDTQDTQDTQDGGKVGLRAEPLFHLVSPKCEVQIPSAKYQAGAVLGVLGVLFVLAKALVTRSGQVPIWPLARRRYAARGAPQTFPPIRGARRAANVSAAPRGGIWRAGVPSQWRNVKITG